jgi:hypothetical protein
VVFDFFVDVVEERVPLCGVEGDRVTPDRSVRSPHEQSENNVILLEGLRETVT